jgi:hypothetical protein
MRTKRGQIDAKVLMVIGSLVEGVIRE